MNTTMPYKDISTSKEKIKQKLNQSSIEPLVQLKSLFATQLPIIFSSPDFYGPFTTTNPFTSKGSLIRASLWHETIYDCCVSNSCGEVVDLLQEWLVNHCSQVIYPRLVSAQQYAALVDAYATEWTNFKRGAITLHHLCDYSNRLIRRGYVPGRSKNISIRDLAWMIWRQQILAPLHKSQQECSLVKSLLLLLNDTRRATGTPVAILATIQTSVTSFVEMGEGRTDGDSLEFYQAHFEQQLFANIQTYYTEKCRIIAQNAKGDALAFIASVQGLIERERDLIQSCIPLSSIAKALQICQEQFITPTMELFHSCFGADILNMADGWKIASQIYDFCLPNEDAVSSLSQVFGRNLSAAIRKDLNTLNYLKSSSKFCIDGLHGLLEGCMDLTRQMFNKDSRFLSLVDECFRSLINNECGSSMPHFIAEYCDNVLREPKLTSKLAQKRLDRAATIFKFLGEKDIFLRVYTQLLASRLIHSPTPYIEELESYVITQFRQICGVDYVSKLQNMLADIRSSRTIFTEKQKLVSCSSFDVLILTSGCWPLSAESSAIFHTPPELNTHLVDLTSFYMKKFTGRKLTWLHSQCRVDVQLNGFDKPYQIRMSLLQYQLLNLFQVEVAIEVDYIQHQMNLPSLESTVHLIQTLAEPLLVPPLVHRMYTTDPSRVFLNMSFTSDAIELSLAPHSTPTTVEVDSSSSLPNASSSSLIFSPPSNNVDEDRCVFLQAMVVRLLKQHRQLPRYSLMSMILDACTKTNDPHVRKSHYLFGGHFIPSLNMLQQALDGLLSKGYVETKANEEDSENGPSQETIYLYVA